MGSRPIPRDREVAPLWAIFSPEKRDHIAQLVLEDRPPPKWRDLGLAQVPSRAWVEWHWYRDIDPFTGRGNLPPGIRQKVIDRDGLRCGLCGRPVEPVDIHIDHIHPRSLGGLDELDNLQVAHSFCNMSKGNRI
jgi:hypothetical protein